MVRQYQHYTHEERLSYLKEFDESGQSVRAFCGNRELNQWTLGKWVKARRNRTGIFRQEEPGGHTLHMQTKTISIIVESKGDYIGGLKGNQGKATEFSQTLFTEENCEKLKIIDGCYHMTSEISHNQLEQRSFYLYPLTSSEKNGLFSEWKKVYAVVCMVKTMIHNVTGKAVQETRYYLTSLKDITDAAHCIRSHWNIENSLHWNLDTTFGEDNMSLSDRNAALNQSILNKACLSLYKKMSDLIGGTQKISKKRLRKIFGWNFNDAMSQALTLMDPPTFAKSVEIIPKKIM